MLNTFEKTRLQEQRRAERDRQMAIMDSVSGTASRKRDEKTADDNTGSSSTIWSDVSSSTSAKREKPKSGRHAPPTGAIENARKFLWEEDEDEGSVEIPGRSIDWNRNHGMSFGGEKKRTLSSSVDYSDDSDRNRNLAPGGGYYAGSRPAIPPQQDHSTNHHHPVRNPFSRMGTSIRNLGGGGGKSDHRGTLHHPDSTRNLTTVDFEQNISPRKHSGDALNMSLAMHEAMDSHESRWQNCKEGCFDVLYFFRNIICTKRTLLLFTILTLVLGTAALLMTKARTNNGSVPGGPGGWTTADQTRLGLITDRIKAAGISSETELMKEGSTANQALLWITEWDAAKLDPNDEFLLQRYALAAFFFSTYVRSELGQEEAGDLTAADATQSSIAMATPKVGWTKSTNWMTSKGLCLWEGVQCHHRSGTAVTDTIYDANNMVTHLNLTVNNIRGTIPVEIKALTDMRVFDLELNEMSGQIPEEIGVLTAMIALYLGANDFTGHIPLSIGKMTNITHLFLYGNRLSGRIPEEFEALTKLRILGLHENHLSGWLHGNFGNLKSVEALYVDKNMLTGQIPTDFGELVELSDLRLGGNKFSGSLPTELGNLWKLEKLYAENNQIGGTLPSEIGKIHKLTDLHLFSNKFSGSIPSELGSLDYLQVLYLDSNTLNGTIPESFRGLHDIQEIYLGGNRLSGPIPSVLGNLKDLRLFRLNDNGFTGTLPSEMGGLIKLESLFLEGNNFKGSLPSNLGELTRLQKLRVNSNDFTGSVPTSVCSLRTDRILMEFEADCNGEISCECCTKCMTTP